MEIIAVKHRQASGHVDFCLHTAGDIAVDIFHQRRRQLGKVGVAVKSYFKFRITCHICDSARQLQSRGRTGHGKTVKRHNSF